MCFDHTTLLSQLSPVDTLLSHPTLYLSLPIHQGQVVLPKYLLTCGRLIFPKGRRIVFNPYMHGRRPLQPFSLSLEQKNALQHWRRFLFLPLSNSCCHWLSWSQPFYCGERQLETIGICISFTAKDTEQVFDMHCLFVFHKIYLFNSLLVQYNRHRCECSL